MKSMFENSIEKHKSSRFSGSGA